MSNSDTKISETVVISNVSPRIEGGKYPVKRVPGESIQIEADIFKDGHDKLSANLLWRLVPQGNWKKTAMSKTFTPTLIFLMKSLKRSARDAKEDHSRH